MFHCLLPFLALLLPTLSLTATTPLRPRYASAPFTLRGQSRADAAVGAYLRRSAHNPACYVLDASHRHAGVFQIAESGFLEHVGSANTTFCSGQSVTGDDDNFKVECEGLPDPKAGVYPVKGCAIVSDPESVGAKVLVCGVKGAKGWEVYPKHGKCVSLAKGDGEFLLMVEKVFE